MSSGKCKLREFYSEHIDNEILGSVDVETREELQQMEIEEFDKIGGGINWDKWDELVKQTKELLDSSNIISCKQSRQQTPKWVYSTKTNELLGEYPTATECGKAFGVSASIVNQYAWRKRPYFKKELYFSNEPLDDNEVPKAKKTITLGVERLYVYQLDTNKLIGVFNSLREAERQYGLPTSTVSYVINQHNGLYQKGNLRFEKKRM